MTYSVKEIFYTLQGEGANTGRPAVFCRFTGCNLWSGREIHRERAICQFCDTDFVGRNGENGGKYQSDEALVGKITDVWGGNPEERFVVFTGGEPALQLSSGIVQGLKSRGFYVAIETNGTLPIPDNVDWVCVSPKANTELFVQSGSEIKLIYPQDGIEPRDFEEFAFDHFFLQPMDNERTSENMKLATEYCMEHSQWRLSTQTHKVIGIP